jgi:hypothetical protein
VADVFISYKREEAEQAQRLATVLENLNFSVWWDTALISGDEYRDVIKEMISKCSAVVVLWSPLAVGSRFVVDEAAFAAKNDKLLPAMLAPCDIPFGFGSDHADDLSGWSGQINHAGFNRLLRSLEAKTKKQAEMAGPHAQNTSHKVEIQAFQAAAKVQSASAWRTFLKDYPGTAFRPFIEAEIGEMESAARAHLQPLISDSVAAGAGARQSERKKGGAMIPLVVGALVLVLAGGAAAAGMSTNWFGLGGPAAHASGPSPSASAPLAAQPTASASAAAAADDEAAWRMVQRMAEEPKVYQGYLGDFPNGVHAVEARAKLASLEEAAWQAALRTNTKPGYEAFQRAWPEGRHDLDSRTKIIEIDNAARSDDDMWAIASAGGGTLEGYRAYLQRYPNGRHKTEAAAAVTRLSARPTPRPSPSNTGPPAPGPRVRDNENRAVKVTNNTTQDLVTFRARVADSTDWGEDRLGPSTIIHPREALDLVIEDAAGSNACSFDIRGAFDGPTIVSEDINVCRIGAITYTQSGQTITARIQ